MAPGIIGKCTYREVKYLCQHFSRDFAMTYQNVGYFNLIEIYEAFRND